MNLSAINSKVITFSSYFGKIIEICGNVTSKMTITRCSNVNITVLALLQHKREKK
jgi:hypothetical protein